MNSDKHIEEMPCERCLHYEGCLKRFREAKSNGLYELIDETEYFDHADDCDMFITGYRKAEDVAREIFEEIEKYVEVALMNGHIETPILCIGHGTFAELKKKYTESSNETTKGVK